MHRRPEIENGEKSPLVPRAMAILLGAWTLGFLILALVVVPLLFAPCTPDIPPQ